MGEHIKYIRVPLNIPESSSSAYNLFLVQPQARRYRDIIQDASINSLIETINSGMRQKTAVFFVHGNRGDFYQCDRWARALFSLQEASEGTVESLEDFVFFTFDLGKDEFPALNGHCVKTQLDYCNGMIRQVLDLFTLKPRVILIGVSMGAILVKYLSCQFSETILSIYLSGVLNSPKLPFQDVLNEFYFGANDLEPYGFSISFVNGKHDLLIESENSLLQSSRSFSDTNKNISIWTQDVKGFWKDFSDHNAVLFDENLPKIIFAHLKEFKLQEDHVHDFVFWCKRLKCETERIQISAGPSSGSQSDHQLIHIDLENFHKQDILSTSPLLMTTFEIEVREGSRYVLFLSGLELGKTAFLYYKFKESYRNLYINVDFMPWEVNSYVTKLDVTLTEESGTLVLLINPKHPMTYPNINLPVSLCWESEPRFFSISKYFDEAPLTLTPTLGLFGTHVHWQPRGNTQASLTLAPFRFPFAGFSFYSSSKSFGDKETSVVVMEQNNFKGSYKNCSLYYRPFYDEEMPLKLTIYFPLGNLHDLASISRMSFSWSHFLSQVIRRDIFTTYFYVFFLFAYSFMLFTLSNYHSNSYLNPFSHSLLMYKFSFIFLLNFLVKANFILALGTILRTFCIYLVIQGILFLSQTLSWLMMFMIPLEFISDKLFWSILLSSTVLLGDEAFSVLFFVMTHVCGKSSWIRLIAMSLFAPQVTFFVIKPTLTLFFIGGPSLQYIPLLILLMRWNPLHTEYALFLSLFSHVYLFMIFLVSPPLRRWKIVKFHAAAVIPLVWLLFLQRENTL